MHLSIYYLSTAHCQMSMLFSSSAQIHSLWHEHRCDQAFTLYQCLLGLPTTSWHVSALQVSQSSQLLFVVCSTMKRKPAALWMRQWIIHKRSRPELWGARLYNSNTFILFELNDFLVSVVWIWFAPMTSLPPSLPFFNLPFLDKRLPCDECRKW